MRSFLLELFKPDGAFCSLMDVGLDGLTDAEHLWEPVAGCWSIRRRAEVVNPGDGTWGDSEWALDIAYPDPQPPPFTTIAWRMAHMTGSVLIAASALRGDRRDDGHLDETWPELQALPLTASQAVDRWNGALDELRRRLHDCSDSDLERVESHAWVSWAEPDPVWKQVEYFGYFEPVSHGAEVRLLRDLFRHTHGGALPLRAPPSIA